METETIYFAQMDTGHYLFTAFGRTEFEAKEAIWKEWNYGRGCEHRQRFCCIKEMEDLFKVITYNTKDIPYGKCHWY